MKQPHVPNAQQTRQRMPSNQNHPETEGSVNGLPMSKMLIEKLTMMVTTKASQIKKQTRQPFHDFFQMLLGFSFIIFYSGADAVPAFPIQISETATRRPSAHVIKISAHSLRGRGEKLLRLGVARLLARRSIPPASAAAASVPRSLPATAARIFPPRTGDRVAHGKIHGENQNPDRRQPGPGFGMRPEQG